VKKVRARRSSSPCRLWHEFEAGETPEARFARALDNLEVQHQHNLADLATWESIEYSLVYSKTGRHTEHDAFLRAFAHAVVEQGEQKIVAGGVDVDAIRAKKQG
jgi:putative hydrolase of HD superfamily